MRLDLQTLRSQVRVHLGVTSTDPDFGDTDVNRLINLSYESVRTRLKLRDIQRFADFTLSAGTESYNFTSAYAIYGALIKDPEENFFTELFPLEAKTYHEKVDSDTTDRYKPTHYYVHDGNDIYFNPVPDQDYTIRVLYLDDVADLSNNTDTLRNSSQVDEIIMYGAVWRGFTQLNFYEKADNIMALQDKLISEFVPVQAIEEQDSRFAQLDMQQTRSYNPRGG